jgi:hypothetical protein
MLLLLQLVTLAALEERLLDELLLRLQLGWLMVHVLEAAWSLECEGIPAIEGLLRKVVITVLDVQLPEILLKVIILVVYAGGV